MDRETQNEQMRAALDHEWWRSLGVGLDRFPGPVEWIDGPGDDADQGGEWAAQCVGQPEHTPLHCIPIQVRRDQYPDRPSVRRLRALLIHELGHALLNDRDERRNQRRERIRARFGGERVDNYHDALFGALVAAIYWRAWSGDGMQHVSFYDWRGHGINARDFTQAGSVTAAEVGATYGQAFDFIISTAAKRGTGPAFERVEDFRRAIVQDWRAWRESCRPRKRTRRPLLRRLVGA